MDKSQSFRLNFLLIDESCQANASEFTLKIPNTTTVDGLAQKILDLGLVQLTHLHHPNELLLWQATPPLSHPKELSEWVLNESEGEMSSPPKALRLQPVQSETVRSYFRDQRPPDASWREKIHVLVQHSAPAPSTLSVIQRLERLERFYKIHSTPALTVIQRLERLERLQELISHSTPAQGMTAIQRLEKLLQLLTEMQTPKHTVSFSMALVSLVISDLKHGIVKDDSDTALEYIRGKVQQAHAIQRILNMSIE